MAAQESKYSKTDFNTSMKSTNDGNHGLFGDMPKLSALKFINDNYFK